MEEAWLANSRPKMQGCCTLFAVVPRLLASSLPCSSIPVWLTPLS